MTHDCKFLGLNILVNTGQVLDEYWRSTGRVLEKYWRSTGQVLDKYWTKCARFSLFFVGRCSLSFCKVTAGKGLLLVVTTGGRF